MFTSPTFTGTVTTTAITTGASTTAGTIVGNWSLTGKWQATYADLAEYYEADSDYEPGTVVELGGEKEVTACSPGQLAIGAVSANPAHLMNSELDSDNVTALALQGRVPCKVLGSVKKGDLLVAAAIPGYAMVDNDAKVGTVIGKALENKDSNDRGVIEIVVGKH